MNKKILGIVLILGIVAALYYFVIRKKGVVTTGGEVSASVLTDMFGQDVLKTSDIVETATGLVTISKPVHIAEVPVTQQAEYMANANEAIKALDNPNSIAGIFAQSILDAGITDAAMIGNAMPGIIGGQVTGVSMVSPNIANALIQNGAETRYFEAAAGPYLNLYLDGQIVAKVEGARATEIAETEGLAVKQTQTSIPLAEAKAPALTFAEKEANLLAEIADAFARRRDPALVVQAKALADQRKAEEALAALRERVVETYIDSFARDATISAIEAQVALALEAGEVTSAQANAVTAAARTAIAAGVGSAGAYAATYSAAVASGVSGATAAAAGDAAAGYGGYSR